MSVSPILYEYALDAYGRPQHIRSSDYAPPYKCGDCSGELIAKRGRIRQWHYAHKTNVICTPKPDPDNALHRYAQAIIVEAFNRCKADGTEYLLGMKCSGFQTDTCDERLAINIALPETEICKEISVVPHTRSDLALFKFNDSTVILEVVNTHPLDPDTKERYLQSKIAVYIRTLTWDTLHELSSEFIADKCLNVESQPLCVQCLQRKESFEAERERELAREAAIKESFEAERKRELKRQARILEDLVRRKQIIERALKRLVRNRRRDPQFRPWYRVKKETWWESVPEIKMYPKTQRAVFANAIILTELGFEQHNQRKPWLFRFNIHKSGKYIYADLGGSDVIPIYQDTAAMLYAPDLEGIDQLAQYGVEWFADSLRSHGVNVRVGFLSDYHIDDQHIDPIRHIDKSMLDNLVKWIEKPEMTRTAQNHNTRKL